MSVLKITKENFNELAENNTLLLDFWAEWCGPCRLIAPAVEQIAEEREDILVGKVDVDEQMDLAKQFGITSIPTLILLEKGQVKAQSLGYRTKEELLRILGL